MFQKLSTAALIIFTAACGENSEEPPPPVIQTGTLITLSDGQIQGAAAGMSRRFLAIPFAKPPVGALRWKAPVKNDPFPSVRDATQFSGRCAQPGSLQADGTENEDCLYLNVWTPEPAPATALPVMVWFHGGGNVTGSASDLAPLGVGGLFYDGQVLAERYRVVVVTTNYRLGPLGFFYHPGLAGEGSPEGNQGLLDQRRALEWVRDNIAPFGGDAANVTIFGESAGSFDVCFHVASPGSAGLFHRAISESGGCTTKLATKAGVQAGVTAFVEAMGCTGAADALACLRAKPVIDLLTDPPVDGAPATPLPGGQLYQGGTARWDFAPLVDGVVLPDQPRSLFDRGQVNKVPYILGTNTDEGTLFHFGAIAVTTEEEYLAALERRFGATGAAAVAAVSPVTDFASPNAALQRVTGDAALVCGTHDTARRAAAAGMAVHMYNFDFPLPIPGLEFLGATHGAEIAFVFGSVDADAQGTVGETIRGYWTRLAKTGDPNGGAALAWPAFSAAADMRINLATDISVVSNFRSTECTFWRTLYDTQFQ
jgi:para-nitrobenzyl esterase